MAERALRRHELLETLQWKANQLDLMPKVHYSQSEIQNRKTDPSSINQKQERRMDQKMAQHIHQEWTSLGAIRVMSIISRGLPRRAREVETKAKAKALRREARSLSLNLSLGINQQQQSQIPNSSGVTMTWTMMLNPRNPRHQKRTRIGRRSRLRMTLQGDQSNQKGPRTWIKTELRHQNLLQERLQKRKIKTRIKKRTRKVTNHQVKIKIKVRLKTLLRNLYHHRRRIHQPRSLLVMIIIMLPQKMPKAFGRHLRSQRQRLMLQRIRAGNLVNQKKIKTRTREPLKRKALIRRGAQISLRQSPRLEMKGIKLQQTHLMLEFHQMDQQAMMTEMTVQPKRATKETWRRMRSLLQLERERNERSTSHSTMWMFLVSKLCGSSSRHDAAIPGISRPSPG